MSVNWDELPAVRRAGAITGEMIEQLLDADDIDQKAAYMEKFAQLPEETRLALGYMRCLVESSYWNTHDPYMRFSVEWFQRNRVPPMRLPLRFIGWAGPHNNIGPAYEIDPACLSGEDSRIFYTDDDLQSGYENPEALAKDIAGNSTGIEDVKAETLQKLWSLKRVEESDVRGITFRLSPDARRTITVNGKELDRGEHGGPIFVLAKAGEFSCMLGEAVGGDTSACVILAKHSYCMK